MAVCDVKRNVRDERMNQVNGKYGNKDCKAYNDFREILARGDIDAMHCATPDHWHAIVLIEACREARTSIARSPRPRRSAKAGR